MVWTIEYSEIATKQLSKMNKHIAAKLIDYMDKVAERKNPRELGKPLSGDKAQLWRYRVNDHRIICEVNDNKVRILVLRVGHCKNVYD